MVRLMVAVVALCAALAGCGSSNTMLKNQHSYRLDASDQGETVEVATLPSAAVATIDYNVRYALTITAPAGEYVFKGKEWRGGKYFEFRRTGFVWLEYKSKVIGKDPDREYVIGGIYIAPDGATEVYWHWGDRSEGAVRVPVSGVKVSLSQEIDPERQRAKRERDERERLAEIKRQQEEEARQLAEQRKAALLAELAEAKRRDRVLCAGAAQCDRAFALAQAYLLKQADMRIQVATSTLIETYNATEDGRLQMRLVRVPTAGDQWEVVISAACRNESRHYEEVCSRKLLAAYSGFLPHMRQN